MENRSYALWAGLFTLVLVAAAVVVVIVLGRDRTQAVTYEILSSASVGGLSPQSSVRFQGVPVGRVQALLLDPNKPGQVRIRVAISPTTPITDATWAELGMQGITGLGIVELRDDGKSANRLVTSVEHPAEIPLRPGLVARLEERSSALLDNLDQATGQIKAVLSPENARALALLLQNAVDVSTQLKQSSRNLGPMIERLDVAALHMGETMQETGALVRDARGTLASLSAPNGPMGAATQSLNEITSAAARINGQTLPTLSGMASEVSSTARNASSVLNRVGDAPQSLLFGLPPSAPGPGESGFAGFGSAR